MCLAVPMKVTKLDPPMATVEVSGVSREVNVDLVEGVEVDDYVIIHAGYAIEKMAPEEALETIDLLRQVVETDGPLVGVDASTATTTPKGAESSGGAETSGGSRQAGDSNPPKEPSA